MTQHAAPDRAARESVYLLSRAKDMSEADLQACVENAARYRGWRAYHTHDSRRSQAGFPDLVLIRGNRILWRELKTMTGRTRPEQQAWISDLTTAGADVAIWRPIDWLNGTIDADLDADAATPTPQTTTALAAAPAERTS